MNNSLLRNVVKNKCSSAKRFEFFKNALIYTDNTDKRYVAKKNENDILSLYNYLNSRGFEYLPRLKYCDDDCYIYEYLNDIDTPSEQKMSDIIKLDALLHNKTVFYKDISVDEIKEMYENLNAKIKDTYTYYDDLITMIESKVYMSPSEYMLARNCSSIFSCLNFCQNELEKWYELMNEKNKKRVALIHNDLDISHFVRSNDNTLISWDKATRDLPIYDFIKLYKKNYNKFNFNELLKEYKKTFPLLEEEIKLLYIILFIPWKIEFKQTEIESTMEVSKLCNYLFITDHLFMENEAKDTKKQNHDIDKK